MTREQYEQYLKDFGQETPAPIEQAEDTEAVIAKAKQKSLRDQIVAAYESYLRGEPLSTERLMGLVIKFAYRKVYHLEYEFKDMGTAQTADDWSQEVALKVWEALPRLPEIVPNGEKFYSYINKATFNKDADAFNYLTGKILNDKKEVIGYRDEGKGKAPLMVEREAYGDGGSDTYEDVNPEIYQRTTINESHFTIPNSVTGIDRDITYLLLDFQRRLNTGRLKTDNFYELIGAKLGMSKSAVERRIGRMRERLSVEKETKDREARAKNNERWAEAHKPIQHPKKRPSEALPESSESKVGASS
jgi:hypothetical protein